MSENAVSGSCFCGEVSYEISGKGVADESSFKEALFKSIELFKKRSDYLQLNQNKLKATKRL